MEANRSTSGFGLGLQLQNMGESHTSPVSTETQGHCFNIDKDSGRIVGFYEKVIKVKAYVAAVLD